MAGAALDRALQLARAQYSCPAQNCGTVSTHLINLGREIYLTQAARNRHQDENQSAVRKIQNQNEIMLTHFSTNYSVY